MVDSNNARTSLHHTLHLPAALPVFLVLLALPLMLAGCAGLPPGVAERPAERALSVTAEAPLAVAAAQGLAAAQPAGPSAVLSLAHPSLALDARLTLQLPMQQINFLEVAAGFFRLHDQHRRIAQGVGEQ